MLVRNFNLGREYVVSTLYGPVIILAIGVAVELIPGLPDIVHRLNAWLQGLTQPLILVFFWDVITREIITLLQLPSRGVVSLMIIYYVLMFAPFASVIGGQLSLSIERFIFVFSTVQVVFTPLIALPRDLVDNRTLLLALSTGAVGALAYFIMISTSMRAWRLSWPGLKPHFSGDFNWLILLFFVVLFFAMTYLNAGAIAPNHLGSKKELLTAFEAGVAEETLFRFAILGVLFYAWRNIKQRLPLAIITSSILFGLVHLINAAQQELGVTVFQAVAAAGIGLFFAMIYVYTGQLWLVILMHGYFDWTSFIVSGATSMTEAHIGLAPWIAVLCEVAVFVLILVWMLLGQRRVVMERHVARLTGTKQHFDYQIRY
ncbi:MAG: CPBP family intramembrane metalloprotease [Limosilactobacillus sp.]|nr:CPBP family intramembrane metalloprotease [Limosilactobacillus sp.]